MSCYLLESAHFNPGLLNPRPFNHEVFNPLGGLGLRRSWLKNLGLRSPGLKFEVEKYGVGMSCNLLMVSTMSFQCQLATTPKYRPRVNNIRVMTYLHIWPLSFFERGFQFQNMGLDKMRELYSQQYPSSANWLQFNSKVPT